MEEFGHLVGGYYRKAEKEAVRELTLSEGFDWTVVKQMRSDPFGVK